MSISSLSYFFGVACCLRQPVHQPLSLLRMFSKSAVDAGAICGHGDTQGRRQVPGMWYFSIPCDHVQKPWKRIVEIWRQKKFIQFYRHVLACSIFANHGSNILWNANWKFHHNHGFIQRHRPPIAQLGTNLRLRHSLCGLICQVFGQLTQSGTLVGTCWKMVVKHGRDLCCGYFLKSGGTNQTKKGKPLVKRSAIRKTKTSSEYCSIMNWIGWSLQTPMITTLPYTLKINLEAKAVCHGVWYFHRSIFQEFWMPPAPYSCRFMPGLALSPNVWDQIAPTNAGECVHMTI